MRRALDLLYAGTATIAAIATVLVGVVVLFQVGGRMLGFGIRGADDVVAWLTASASLSGIGYAFAKGAHVRVELLVDRLSGRVRRSVELLASVIALAISCLAAYASVTMVYESYAIGDVSQGQIPVQLWIPQLGIAVGTVTLAVAVADKLYALLSGRTSPAAKGASTQFAEV